MCYLGALPSLFFWTMLVVGRHELGWKWIVGLIAAYAGSFICLGAFAPGMAPGLFLSAQALLVIITAFKVFGLNIPSN